MKRFCSQWNEIKLEYCIYSKIYHLKLRNPKMEPVQIRRIMFPSILSATFSANNTVEAIFGSRYISYKKHEEFVERSLLLSSDDNIYETRIDEVPRFPSIEENGQKKLLYGEIYFLSSHLKGDNPIVLYIGASPGLHLDVLVRMFPHVKFILYDAEPFKISDETRNKVEIFEEYFTDSHCKRYSKIQNLYFISDIRDRDMILGIVSPEERKHGGELIMEDMESQVKWSKLMNPVAAMLKFRIPLPNEAGGEKTYLEYPPGILLKQPFFKKKGVELRLITTRPDESVKWFISDIYRRLLYHNIVIRESYVYKNPFTRLYHAIYLKTRIGNNWDSSAAVFILLKYLRYVGRGETPANLYSLLDLINDVLWN